MHGVSYASLIGGMAGLDAADSVCFLLAETAGKQPREVDGKARTTTLMGTGRGCVRGSPISA